MMPGTTTPTDRDEERAEARRKVAAAVDLVSGYAMLTARQRGAILEALNAADWQIALQYAEVKRLEHEAARLGRVHPELSTYIEAAHGLICNAHRTTVDHVTEADGASPGWAEAARRWIDAYPPTLTHDGHAEFAAEVRRLTDQHHRAQVEKLTRERDRLRRDLDQTIGARNELAESRDSMRAERDKAVHQLGRATDRADAHRRARVAAEDRLEQIAGILNRTPFPADRTDPEPEPGDSWTDHVHERQELARKLRADPRPIRIVRDHSTGQDHHVYDPDYTEADLDPATAADEETPV